MISQHYKPRKPGILDARIYCAKMDALQATYEASRESKVAVMVLLYGGTPKGRKGFTAALLARNTNPLDCHAIAHAYTEHGASVADFEELDQ